MREQQVSYDSSRAGGEQHTFFCTDLPPSTTVSEGGGEWYVLLLPLSDEGAVVRQLVAGECHCVCGSRDDSSVEDQAHTHTHTTVH